MRIIYFLDIWRRLEELMFGNMRQKQEREHIYSGMVEAERKEIESSIENLGQSMCHCSLIDLRCKRILCEC
jgi:hypothetical protein